MPELQVDLPPHQPLPPHHAVPVRLPDRQRAGRAVGACCSTSNEAVGDRPAVRCGGEAFFALAQWMIAPLSALPFWHRRSGGDRERVVLLPSAARSFHARTSRACRRSWRLAGRRVHRLHALWISLCRHGGGLVRRRSSRSTSTSWLRHGAPADGDRDPVADLRARPRAPQGSRLGVSRRFYGVLETDGVGGDLCDDQPQAVAVAVISGRRAAVLLGDLCGASGFFRRSGCFSRSAIVTGGCSTPTS